MSMTEKEMIEAMLNSTNCAEQEWFNNGDVAETPTPITKDNLK